MSIKFSPGGNFPYTSSFAVTSSFSEDNAGAIISNGAIFSEDAGFSLDPLGSPRGIPGRTILTDGRNRELIELVYV